MQFMNRLNMLSDSHLEIPKIPFAKSLFQPLFPSSSLSLFLFLYSAIQIFFSSKNPPNCYPFSSLSPSSSYLPLQPAFSFLHLVPFSRSLLFFLHFMRLFPEKKSLKVPLSMPVFPLFHPPAIPFSFSSCPDPES